MFSCIANAGTLNEHQKLNTYQLFMCTAPRTKGSHSFLLEVGRIFAFTICYLCVAQALIIFRKRTIKARIKEQCYTSESVRYRNKQRNAFSAPCCQAPDTRLCAHSPCDGTATQFC